MNLKCLTTRLLLSLMVGLASSCTVATLPVMPSPTLTPGSTFVLYQTQTPSPTIPAPSGTSLGVPGLPSATLLPTITATPRSHVVKAGEDMGGIALRYRVPLKDLMAANPAVNPRLMKVGTVLVVPGAAPLPTSEARASATPQPVRFDASRCLADPASGSWCFARVFNQSGTVLINVTLLVRLVDASGKELARQNASLPLDLLPAGGMLPLAVYFSVPLPEGAQAGVQLVAALPATAAGERYPAVKLSRQQITIAADGGSAVAVGQAELANAEGQPAQMAVLAVAYTGNGSLTAVRLWQSPAAGRSAEYQVRLYALGGTIERVEVFAEAHY